MGEKFKLLRIGKKLNEIFSGYIDASDLKRNSAVAEDKDLEFQTHLQSRALAALAIMIQSGTDAATAGACITDGYDDLGIDAIFNDTDQKKLLIVQSKWRSSASGSISQNEMLTFVRGVELLTDLELDAANAKLKAKYADIKQALSTFSYKIELVFSHTGDQACNSVVKQSLDDLMARFNDQETEVLTFRELKLQEVYDYFAAGQHDAEISLENVLVENWGVVDSPFRAYYGVIPAGLIGEWYALYGNRLFDKNIRFYKGSTEVNKGIQDVLLTEPENFFYYNNGIKLLCRKINKMPLYATDTRVGMFHLEGVSLVNGAQTTGSIGAAFKLGSEMVKKAKVLVQIIELGDGGVRRVAHITRLTNTQNRIEGKDFAALDPQQERIRVDLSFYGIEYLYKTGAVITDPKSQMLIDEAIVAQACASSDVSYVHLAKQNVGALTEDIEKPPYTILFNGSTNSFSLANNIRILRMVEDFVHSNQEMADAYRRMCLIHGNRVLLYLVLSKLRSNSSSWDRELIDVESMKNEVNEACSNFLEQIVKVVSEKYQGLHSMSVFKSSLRTRKVVGAILGWSDDDKKNTAVQGTLELDFRATGQQGAYKQEIASEIASGVSVEQ